MPEILQLNYIASTGTLLVEIDTVDPELGVIAGGVPTRVAMTLEDLAARGEAGRAVARDLRRLFKDLEPIVRKASDGELDEVLASPRKLRDKLGEMAAEREGLALQRLETEQMVATEQERAAKLRVESEAEAAKLEAAKAERAAIEAHIEALKTQPTEE